ncbi:hypothetical protein HPB47_020386 [Ixodes persulcatus]|uniref:Uncharacterized protein n=1 Tax=Ixodes persulcatus TaxID=34615 RepID=A0AC60QJ36_IXOPE|nr:hypothetical protein HPB47_020386 [Ixodes persulcatus]
MGASGRRFDRADPKENGCGAAGKTEAVRGQAPKRSGGNGKKQSRGDRCVLRGRCGGCRIADGGGGNQPARRGDVGGSPGSETPDDAEAQAILTAVKHAYAEADKRRDNEDRKKPTTVLIFTDSQEVLRACKEYRLASPTVREIMKTAIRAREHHGIRLQLRWVPGPSGVEGNEAAHVAARKHKRFLLSSANGPLRQRGAEISNGYREYNPTALTTKAKAKLKKEMRTRLPQEPYPIPTRDLRRYQTVLLRRVRTGSAITPYLLKKWADEKKKRNDPEFVTEPPSCNHCKKPTRPDVPHLLWECEHFKKEREEAIATLKDEERPGDLGAWIRPPEEDEETRLRVLRSVVFYMEKTGLSQSF